MPRYIRLPNSFRTDDRGNVAMIFALTSVVAVSVVGGAVDFGRVFSMRAELQSVLDAAALAGGAHYAQTSDLAAAKAMTQKLFQERYTANTGGSRTVPTMTFESTSALITAKAKVDVSTPFLSFVLTEAVPLEVSSSVSLGGKKLEVALMFDVTGSMTETTTGNRTKIDDAKAAAKDLISIVLPDSGAFDTHMSLIPFSQRVKLDADAVAAVTGMPKTRTQTATQTTTWKEYSLSTTSFDWVSYERCVDKLRDDYFKKIGQSDSQAEASATAYCDGTQTQRQGRRTEYKRPDIITTDRSSEETVTYQEYISPCVIERNTTDAARKAGDAAPASGEWTATYNRNTLTADVSCPPNGNQGKGTLIPLTSSASALRTAIDDLQTGGGTAGHIGTAWSLYTLSPKWASALGGTAPAAYDDSGTMKAAVLMTDGEYNNCNGGTSCTTSSAQAIAICTKMKEEYNITVYTIGFGMSTDEADPARQTLVSCASPGKYYFPYDGDELRAAFADIGAALVSGGAGPRLMPANQVTAVTTP